MSERDEIADLWGQVTRKLYAQKHVESLDITFGRLLQHLFMALDPVGAVNHMKAAEETFGPIHADLIGRKY